jgi:murein DD-endopeptidase MepM/ murein hydrolase activator NlpD
MDVLLVSALMSLWVAFVPPVAPSWRWPVSGHPRVIRHFSPPPAPWLAGHRGADLALPPQSPVLAAGSGTIGFAAPVGGRGVVTIHHPNGLRTTYLPVTPGVRKGQAVTIGTRLGTLQPNPPPHCLTSCLHWGLRRGPHYLDPLLLLGAAHPRLLPYWPTGIPTGLLLYWPRVTPTLWAT